MALAHVSAQANHLAQVHAVFTDRQAEHEAHQKQFIEERVAHAREEAEKRTQELVRAISAAYGDPTALERRVDDRIQNVLMTLQDNSLIQAREMAEAQLAEQNAAGLAMETRIEAELLDVQESAVRRAEQSVQALVNKLSTDQQQLMVFQQAAASDRHELQVNLERLEKQTI
ncbi:hypothetical protein V7S43_007509 [Phytophthora oleae]|uniref:Uncharacterized protein n=1 Tax=Phytophthora oleae TaxID=2107226 RepID=A0ABD3FK45_9STRA